MTETSITIHRMQNRAWQNSEDHGFHQDLNKVPTPEEYRELVIISKLMLSVSELAEALEEIRDGKPLIYYKLPDGTITEEQVYEDGVPIGKPEGLLSEMADVIIRTGDLAGILKVDLEKVVLDKMAYNATRPFKHGRRL